MPTKQEIAAMKAQKEYLDFQNKREAKFTALQCAKELHIVQKHNLDAATILKSSDLIYKWLITIPK